MPLAVAFWILFLLAIVFGFWGTTWPGNDGMYVHFGGKLVIFILVGLLGWRVFGPAVKG